MSAIAILAAFLRRDWMIDTSYRATFALELLATLFLLTLFFYLSHVVDEAQFSAQQNLSSGYFGFAAVGLALLEILQVSLTSFSRKLREEQTTGTFEALMASPASPSLIILSSAAYDLLRATFDALVLLLAAVTIFGLEMHTDAGSAAVATATLLGSVGLFASLGVTVAALTVIIKRAAGISGIAITGLALLGGVYFPIDVMPEPLHFLAEALPFTWALDVLRASLLGGETDPAQVAGLFASVAVLLPLSLVGFGAAVTRARRTGSLAQY